MSMTEALKQGNFSKEKSTVGDRPIYEGVYKATFVDWKQQEDKGYGASIRGDFKISEVLYGRESNSKYAEFVEFFNTSPEKIANKRNGLAKLINGLFSVGYDVNTENDEALVGSLEGAKGQEVFISAYKQKKMKKEGEGFVELEGEYKQGWTFMTEKNALAEAKKKQAKDGVNF